MSQEDCCSGSARRCTGVVERYQELRRDGVVATFDTMFLKSRFFRRPQRPGYEWTLVGSSTYNLVLQLAAAAQSLAREVNPTA